MWKLRKETLAIVAFVLNLVVHQMECTVVEGKTLDPIYWNSSNPMFKSGTTQRSIDAAINDKLDIICPRRDRDDGEELFYFKLYLVSKENYQECNIKGGKRLITCDVPHQEKKYTFLFQDISPSPWGLEFTPDKSYYVVSTSDGSKSGIDIKQGGVCTRFNMKMEVKIHEAENPSDREEAIDQPYRPYPPTEVTPLVSGRSPSPREPEIDNINVKDDKDEISSNREGNETANNVTSNGLIIGIALGACAVLFIVLLILLGYKMYRRRTHLKKYQSPPLSPACSTTPLQQVTLLPINPHTYHRDRLHSDHERLRSATLTSHVSMRAPPSYNESFLDNGGPVVAV